MAKKAASQTEMFEQKKVRTIETWIDKADETRSMINGLKATLKNQEFKLAEVMNANENDVDHQVSDDGDHLLIYKRGDYTAVVKRGKLKVNYKRASDSKGEPPAEAEEPEASE